MKGIVYVVVSICFFCLSSNCFAGQFCFDKIANLVEKDLNKKMADTRLEYIVYSIEHIGASGTAYSADNETYVDLFKVSANSNSRGGDQVWLCNDLTVAVVPDYSAKCNVNIDSIKSKDGSDICMSDGLILK